MKVSKNNKRSDSLGNQSTSDSYEKFYSEQRKLTSNMYATYNGFGKSYNKQFKTQSNQSK